ncbi:MAG: SdpI family protein [Candidatus Neomarinimicrobiota bacterium]|jgi:uncharacterized membrane protein|nr:SdpI family protein [Candidatus Neomarinimicrobiota bacterium]MDD3967013.1 SdpI family protein [Candidatus Neomarinimicrobiota bacterium]MDX9780567.1 SdpI family protein [bacterium]
MNTFRREIAFLLLFFAISAVISVYFYAELKAAGVTTVPIHWNILNEPDLFAKTLTAVLIGPLAILLMIVILLSSAFRKYEKQEQRSVRFVVLLISAVLVVMNWIALSTALRYGAERAEDFRLLHLVLGLLFILIGNRFGKLRPSYWIGIRTPLTLSNEELWNRVHRKGGRLMVISGIFILAGLFFVNKSWFWVFYLPLLISIVLSVFVIPRIEKRKMEI